MLIWVLGVSFPTVNAQNVVHKTRVLINSTFVKATLRNELLCFDTIDQLEIADAIKALKNPNISHPISSTSFGFSNNFYWLYFTIENTDKEVQNMVIVINNPHINNIKLYQDLGNQFPLVARGGDGMPFSERSFINRTFIAPVSIAPHQSASYFVMVDKRHASVSVPISVENQYAFEKRQSIELFNLGIYFGSLILIVLYSLIVYSKIKLEIFFWYAFYIFFLGLYLMAHLGLFFQYAHPNLYSFSDYARPLFVTWLSTGLVRFIQLLIRTKEYLPKLEQYYKYLLFTLNIITIWWWATPWWHDQQTIWFLNTQNTLIIISLIMVLVSAVFTFNRQRTLVTFFFVAFMAVLMGGLSIILIEMGVVSEDIFPMNPILVGSMVEIIVFAFGLSYWMRLMNNEREQLAKEIQGVESKLIDSYISGIESEKKKIAAELHDDIGSRLSHLKRTIELDNGNSELLAKLEGLNKTVRRLSHELATPRFETDEFLISVQHLIRSHEAKDLNLSFQVFDVPNNLNSEIQKHLYRIIQSALSNIELHANATNVDIQFFFHNNELVLAIEDNGVGFLVQSTYSGNGIKSMQSRVEALGGTIEISSSKQHGTSIMITILVPKENTEEPS